MIMHLGTCHSDDGYVSNGIVHQSMFQQHPTLFMALKPEQIWNRYSTENCTGNEGIASVALFIDDGFSLIQAQDGYLLGGFTQSNAFGRESSCRRQSFMQPL